MIFWLSKKDFKNISEYPDTWSIVEGTYQSKPIFVRIKTGIEEGVGHPKYPFQIGVAVPLLDPTVDGLTKDNEAEVLWDFEDRLAKTLQENNEMIFVMTITTGGMREFVFYASEWKPEYFEQKVKAIEAGLHKPQFMMQHDPEWKTYLDFLPKAKHD